MKQLFILLFFFLTSPIFGITLGGYLENNNSAIFSSDERITYSALLRLEGEHEFGERGLLQVHLATQSNWAPLNPFYLYRSNSRIDREIQTLMSGFQFNLPLTGDPTLDQQFSTSLNEQIAIGFASDMMDHITYSSFYPNNTITLDRTLLKLFFPMADITIGSQQIGWGTGYGFNPTDIWNQKSPTDVNAPKLGVGALRSEFHLGQLSQLDVIFAPGKDLEHSSWGLRVKSNFNFDFSFSMAQFMNSDRALYGLNEKSMLGFDFAGQLFWEIGFWGEGAYFARADTTGEYTEIDSSYFQTDLGIDYTFENGLYLLSEYYYNGLGQTNQKNYSASELLHVFSGEMSGFAQHYLMLGFRKTYWNDWHLSVFSLSNLNDISMALLPGVQFDFTEDLSIHLDFFLNGGKKEETELGSMYNSGRLKLVGFF